MYRVRSSRRGEFTIEVGAQPAGVDADRLEQQRRGRAGLLDGGGKQVGGSGVAVFVAAGEGRPARSPREVATTSPCRLKICHCSVPDALEYRAARPDRPVIVRVYPLFSPIHIGLSVSSP
ncbi:hypothetical protein Asi03nite_29680 [Actinoplanes siamensis]|uniref:Uncharacterized protein n=1 Tax=Actinoplanes siamensis TaxID=1223317 RepID=A0A919N6V1_9ACTN|nr:hypothetical protein Asi03nite_29680 [Actinoplanes siamensis]